MFLGKELSQSPGYSDALAEKIDTEIGNILQRARSTAKNIIEAHKAKLTLLAKRLLTEETIEGPGIMEILSGSPEGTPEAA